MRPAGPAALLEDRRHRALKLLDSGLSLSDVARRIGCAPSSVLRWRDARKRGGRQALKVRFSPGRPPKLTAQQRRALLKELAKGPLAHGYRTSLWTTARISEVIRIRFAVRYHRDHVGRLMRSLGWSYQKPKRRASQRDEARIARFKGEDWDQVKKTPGNWGPTSSSRTKRASS